MIGCSIGLSRNYALDFTAFHSIRTFRDGITFAQILLNLDLFKCDHNPQFTFSVFLFNFKIIEINIYNVNHTYNMSQAGQETKCITVEESEHAQTIP